MRVSSQSVNFHFWVNYPFNIFLKHVLVSGWSEQQRIKKKAEKKRDWEAKTEGKLTQILFNKQQRGAKERAPAENPAEKQTDRHAGGFRLALFNRGGTDR